VNAETVRLLAAYTRWADERMFAAVGALASEAFLRDLGSSLKSVRDTVSHLVGAQWVWFGRWTGAAPRGLWDAAGYPDLPPLRARWEETWREMGSFLEGRTDDQLRADCAYTNTKGRPFTYPLGALVLHMVNHSSYHRGQVATLLRQLGAQAVSTDLVVYLGTRP